MTPSLTTGVSMVYYIELLHLLHLHGGVFTPSWRQHVIVKKKF